MTDAPATPPSRKGGPQMIILLIVIVGPSFAIGSLLGAGGAAIIGGFIAMFSVISTMGGPLRANLARFAFVGPLVAFGAVAPRLLAEWSLIAGIVLATIMVFIAGLLPLRGRRYDGTALGLGMGVLLGYAMPVGVVTGWRLVAAALAGLVVGLGMLLLTGAKDPSGPTRTAVAGLLDEQNRDFAAAFEAWSSDRAPRWLGTVLLAAGRYRLARRVLANSTDPATRAALETAGERASVIADAVRMKAAAAEPLAVEVAPPVSAPPAVVSMFVALDRAAVAANDRETEAMAVPTTVRDRVSLGAVRAAVGRGAIQLRHAVRTTVAALLALLVSLLLTHGDPLLPTLLMTTFGIVQASWHATIARARDRLIGIIAGGLLVVLMLVALPASWLFPLSMVGLAVGMWFITARPALGTAGLIVMSVGLNSEMRQLDPFAVVVEYVVLTMIALLIGGVIGFVIVPSWRPPALRIRVADAVARAAEALRELGGERHRGSSDRRLEAVAAAQAATQQLVPDHEKLSAEQQEELERLRNAVQDLVVTSIFVVASGTGADEDTLRRAGDELIGSSHPDDSVLDGDESEATVLLLAREVRAQRDQLEATLA